MRYGVLAVMMFVAAAMFSAACSSPYAVARGQIGNFVVAVKTMDTGVKTTTKSILEQTVAKEKAKRTDALKAKGCPLDAKPASTDPALAPCAKVWDDALASYDAEAAKIEGQAKKVDAAIEALTRTIPLAVQIVAEAEKGLNSKAKMLDFVKGLLPLFEKVKAAYDGWKVFAAGFTALPGWLP